jgi:hypothetical protein
MSKLSPEEEESIEAELAALQQEAMPSVPVNVSLQTVMRDTVADPSVIRQQEPVHLPSVPVHQPVEQEAEEVENRREKQKQREEDLRMAMTA